MLSTTALALKFAAFCSVTVLFFSPTTSGQEAIYYAQKTYPAYTHPCGQCQTGPRHPDKQGLWRLQAYGGQPYRATDKRTQLIDRNQKHGLARFSTFWPAPFHGIHGYGLDSTSCRSTCNPRPRDLLDGFAYFKLVPANVRRDSGYCGPGCDPYGYLGQSQSHLNNGWTAPSYVSRRYPPVAYPSRNANPNW